MPETLYDLCSWDDPGTGHCYRYWLEADLGAEGEGICLVIGLNPSKAGRCTSDGTLERAKHIARKKGYRALWVCNLFPMRGANFGALPGNRLGPPNPRVTGCTLCRGNAHTDLHINERHILAAASWASVVICAWGGNGLYEDRAHMVAKRLVDNGHGDELHIFGLTRRDDQPKHVKPRNPRQWPGCDDLRPWTDVREWLGR